MTLGVQFSYVTYKFSHLKSQSMYRINLLILLLCVGFSTFQYSQSLDKYNYKKGALPYASDLGKIVQTTGKNLDCIFQDSRNHYWFGSNGEGVYRYDGQRLVHITKEDGLCSNFVWSVQEDIQGHIWFSTRDGICRFDGSRFTDMTKAIQTAPFGPLRGLKTGLFFNSGDGIACVDGTHLSNFVIHPDNYAPEKSTLYRPYAMYSNLVDSKERMWFGTQEMGVCCYDGTSISWLNQKDLGGPAVRAIFEDRDGILWFGNNGGGLFRYDGIKLRNITEENKLGNYVFLRAKQPVNKPGSLARVFAINQDRHGNLWAGTADAGAWRWDGKHWKNFTAEHGLSGTSVTVIYKDKSGELWFISNGDSICRFDGNEFVSFSF